MSTPVRRRRRSEDLRLSAEDIDSDVESEGQVSSVIRLPGAKLPPAQDESRLQQEPPPLPPKPEFARGGASALRGPPPPLPPKPSASFLNQSTVTPPPLPPKPVTGLPTLNSAPPLPPKPDHIRGEALVELSLRRQTATTPTSNFDGTDPSEHAHNATLPPPPTRPVPAVPRSDRKPSYGEDGSWVPSYLDDRSQLDPPQPPEPTIISEGEPIRSSLGNLDASTLSLSDQVPNLTLPLPPPTFTAQNQHLSSLFPPVPTHNAEGRGLSDNFIFLSIESAEDSNIGAIMLSRERLKRKHLPVRLRPSPIQWRPYVAQEPGGEAWSVLHEYLTNSTLKAHGRNRALQLLTGYVVGACLESRETGIGILSEIVRRMRGAERSERDGSIFTLLINIAAHASFVRKSSWASVEEVARKVFSDVVEEMHGRQDDDVMWERALRCFLLLLKASNQRPCDQISSRCLTALALHVGEFTHGDVHHVLVTEGICSRIQGPRDEKAPSVGIDFTCLEEIGGLQTVLTLFADTISVSSRHALFRVIYDIAVMSYLESVPENEVEILRDHIVTLRALFEAFEFSDCFVHACRVGPVPEFIMDVVRMLLFDPLTGESLSSLSVPSTEEREGTGKRVLQEKTESNSLSETRLSGTLGRQYRSSASKHVLSISALVRLLDKPFCLKVVQQLENMSTRQAKLVSQRESLHFPREWKIFCEMEKTIQSFIFQKDIDTGNSVDGVLSSIYSSVVDLTSGRSSLRSIMHMAEIIIDFFTVKPPFSKQRGIMPVPIVDSAAKLFLKGRLIVSKKLLSQANPSIFTLLLVSSTTKTPRRRVSECRQCLVEFLGSQRGAELLQPFADDEDAAVAYRAAELVSRCADVKR